MKGRLEVKDLTMTFAGKRRDTVALDGIDLTVAPGEFVCIVGTSGCGKSTLLSIIAGLLEQTSGDVLLAIPVAQRHGEHRLRAGAGGHRQA
jgi:NitT/TauT family transport system ATP-binding protein